MENNQPQPQKDAFKDRVLKKIGENHVHIYSKARFTLKTLALIAVAILMLSVSVLLFSFLLFSIRVSGRAWLLGFGSQGWLFFLRFFPWTLLLLDIILIGVFESLLRKFRFGYRKPVLYLLLGLFAFTMALGAIVDRGIGVNEALLRRADEHGLPSPIEELYESARRPSPYDAGMCRCTITAIDGNILMAEDVDPNGEHTMTIVVATSDPALPLLRIGEVVFAAGTMSGTGTINAFGVHPLPPGTATSGQERMFFLWRGQPTQ